MSRKITCLLGLSLLLVACTDGPAAPPATHAAGETATLSQGAGLVRSEFPSPQDPGMPFYARIEPAPPHVYTVDGWAVIPFYRDPACIPADFDLLGFFDAPAAFGCPHLVEGFNLWHGAIGAGAPRVVHAKGSGAVPFWLVPAAEVEAAMQDGTLTMDELAALPGRVAGHATHFAEINHPHALPPFLGGGGHPNPKLVMTARGRLADGRRFDFHLTRHDLEVRSIRLRIR